MGQIADVASRIRTTFYIMSAELRQKTQPERSWSFIDFIAFISLSFVGVFAAHWVSSGCISNFRSLSSYQWRRTQREREKKLETKKEPKRKVVVAIIIIINCENKFRWQNSGWAGAERVRNREAATEWNYHKFSLFNSFFFLSLFLSFCLQRRQGVQSIPNVGARTERERSTTAKCFGFSVLIRLKIVANALKCFW